MALQRTEEGGGQIGEIDVRRFEDRIGHRLPEGYRKFLLTFNGGQPTPDTFIRTIAGEQEACIVHYFFPVNGPVEATPLQWVWDITRETRPGGVLPIASDPFGNFYYLQIQGSDAGSVYFGATPSDGKRASLEKVSNSFGDFVDSLFLDAE